MRSVALEIEAVSGAQFEELVAVEHDLQRSRQDEDEFLSLVTVGAFAGGAGRCSD